MTKLINFFEPVDLSGYTLIIPSVSVGNVPQLTADLLIATYNFKKIATIWHPALVSSVGCDPYYSDINEICTACELYSNPELNLAVIQLRSTLEFKLTLKFFEDLRNEILPMKLKNIILLSSGFDYELRNISNEKFFYASNEDVKNVLESSNVKPLQAGLDGKYLINGSGFATRLYEFLLDAFKCTLLVKFVSEGDNRPDAFTMFEKLFVLCYLQENVTNLTIPSSWEHVFGGPPPLGIY